MNNANGVSGLMLPHSMSQYQVPVQRSDPLVKVESPENLSAHAHYSTASPGKQHSGLENEQYHTHAHSVSALGLTSGETNTLGQVSVGAS